MSFQSTYMVPVSIGPSRQFLPAFDEEYTSVTDLPRPPFHDLEALDEVILVAFAVCEAGAGGLGAAYTAPLHAAIDLGLVEAEHGGVCNAQNTNIYHKRH